MNFIRSIILGVVQGITEFLPISSSAHLVFMQHFLKMDSAQILFDTLLHFSTALVIILMYRREIWQISKNLKKYKEFKNNVWIRTFWLIIIASLITALIGVFFKKYFETVFENIFLVAVLLLVTGFLIWWAKKFEKAGNDIDILNAKVKHAIFIGFMQGIAILPGISRSGATIFAALLCGWRKEETVRFSFLLALPAILGANCIQLKNVSFTRHKILLFQYGCGMFFAFIVGWFSFKFLIGMLKKGKLSYFSYYCWTLGIIVIIINLFNKV